MEIGLDRFTSFDAILKIFVTPEERDKRKSKEIKAKHLKR